MAKKRPQVALVYDFDGTLSPGNMQEFGFIQATGKTKDEFWEKNRKFAEGKDANGILTLSPLCNQYSTAHRFKCVCGTRKHRGGLFAKLRGTRGVFCKC